jgi:CheY-like chemotaxis protein
MSDERCNRKVHILLVEDNPADVHLLRLALGDAELDFALTVFDDGQEALAYVHEQGNTNSKAVDVAILDLNVPKNDGLEILASMRATTVFATLPVIILTSSSSHHELLKLRALNISRHIIKPLDFEEFLRIGSVVKQVIAEEGLAYKEND